MIIERLKIFFTVEDIPAEILDDHLAWLKTEDPLNAFRKFEIVFRKALSGKDTEPNEGIFNNPGPDPAGIFNNLDPDPSVFKKEVLKAFHSTVDEAAKCYEHECYLATIVLCGRIIETLIANVYQVVFRKNPLDDEKMRFEDMHNDLKNKAGLPLLTTVDKLLALIYDYRSKVIHGNIEIPIKDEAVGIVNLTRSVISTTFDYFNNWTTPKKGKLSKDWQSTHTHGDIVFDNNQTARAYRDGFLHEFDSLPKDQSVEFELELRENNLPRARNVVVVEDEE